MDALDLGGDIIYLDEGASRERWFLISTGWPADQITSGRRVRN